MPMNDAVREMLPENRRIWIRRYSRSKDSRASRRGLPMIVNAWLEPGKNAKLKLKAEREVRWFDAPGCPLQQADFILRELQTVPGHECDHEVMHSLPPVVTYPKESELYDVILAVMGVMCLMPLE